MSNKSFTEYKKEAEDEEEEEEYFKTILYGPKHDRDELLCVATFLVFLVWSQCSVFDLTIYERTYLYTLET